jgi:uncharacterized membrane protein YccC
MKTELQGQELVQKAQALIEKLRHTAQDAKDASEAHEREALDLAQNEWRAAHWQLGDLAPALVAEIERLRGVLAEARQQLADYAECDAEQGDAGLFTNPLARIQPVLDRVDAVMGNFVP